MYDKKYHVRENIKKKTVKNVTQQYYTIWLDKRNTNPIV